MVHCRTSFCQIYRHKAASRDRQELAHSGYSFSFIKYCQHSKVSNFNVIVSIIIVKFQTLLSVHNLGHSNIATTSIYVHTDRDERHQAMLGLGKKLSTP
jgi:hypothetical protein